MELIKGFSLKRPKISKLNLLLLLILLIIFSSTILIRVLPAKYGFYLNEFDPYFDYKATKYIVDSVNAKGISGLMDYFSFKDDQAWYPYGRDVAKTSQVGLHFFGALSYLLFIALGVKSSLYDFLVLLPVFLMAFSSLIIFLIGRKLISNTAGLLASLMFAFSPPLIQRGTLGWYKSEPLGLLLGLLGTYLIIAAYDREIKYRGIALRACLAGMILGYANTAWGGSQYFSLIFGLFLILSPLFKVDISRSLKIAFLSIPLILIFSAFLPRPGFFFLQSPIGLLLMLSLFTLLLLYLLSKDKTTIELKPYLTTLIMSGLIGLISISLGFGSFVSGRRYLTVIFPFLRSENPLVESVAEHFVPTGMDYFSYYSSFLFLALFGGYLILKRRDLTSAYLIILALSSIYIASSFSRLMVYSSISLSLLAGLGFYEICSNLTKPTLRKMVKIQVSKGAKFIFSFLMIIILSIPLFYPAQANWVNTADFPTSLASSSLPFKAEIADWREALNWIKDNTPEDSIIAAWWDYGYWITVIGNRNSLADNATMNSTRISQIAKMFISEPDKGVEILRDFKMNSSKIYILIFIAGQKFRLDDGRIVYMLGLGGDESKVQWFIKIGGFNLNDFLEEDTLTFKPEFWDKTLLGKLMPFKLYQYIDQRGSFVGQEYKPGYTPIYVKSYKFDEKSSLKLVFESSSLKEEPIERVQIFAGVVIYELLK
ncbi:MAG: STT3 domain-containing protein [Nitrososphaerales archaeon]